MLKTVFNIKDPEALFTQQTLPLTLG